ncbi:MAG: hypothetical protein ACOCXH_08555 [Cyclobacteriaceae bacterium]
MHTVTKHSEIGWTGKIAWVKAEHNWYFSMGENGTKVVVEESLSGLGSRLMSKSLAEGMVQNLNGLKEYAEQ